jgi:transposase
MNEQQRALRLIFNTKMSNADIAAATDLSKNTVARYRRIAERKRLAWLTIKDWDPSQLDAAFNKPRRGNKTRPPLDFAWLHDHLAARKMKLQVWYEDYAREMGSDRRSYSNIAMHLRRFRKTMPQFMHQEHNPGERVFVDFMGGDLPSYIDVRTGRTVKAQVFVGALGGSSYLFAKAIPDLSVPPVLEAHADMFDFFGGVPHVIVPDNAKCFIEKCGGDWPAVQRGYADLNHHYEIAVLPARPYHPKDKPKVERGVLYLQDHLMSRLRTQTFYSLDELNAAIARLLPLVNGRPMSHGMPSRTERFEQFEREALWPLPPERYEYADLISNRKVDGGYHVLLGSHRYSVPYTLVGQTVDARLTTRSVELFHQGKLVAKHARSAVQGGLTTDPVHQTPAHLAQSLRNPDDLKAWSKTAGPTIARFVHHQFDRDRPFLGLQAADGIKTLVHRHGATMVERALKDFADPKFASITDLGRKLRVWAKEGAKPEPRAPLTNARGSSSFS